MENRLRDRVARVLTSTAHALVEKIEGLNEEGILEAAIREVDGALEEVHKAQGEALARKHVVNKAIERLNLERTRLEEESETAVQNGRDDLAVSGLGRMDDIERQIPELENQMLEHKAEADRLGQSLESLRARRTQMGEDLAHLRRAQLIPPSTASATFDSTAERRADRAENAFNELFAKATGISRSALQPGEADPVKLRELGDFSRQNRIQGRLAELKARIQPKAS
jgi:phage shock protein A